MRLKKSSHRVCMHLLEVLGHFFHRHVLGRDEAHTFIGNTYDNMVPQSWRYAGGVGNTSISTPLVARKLASSQL